MMATTKVPPSERLTSSFKQLANASVDLDAAAGELRKVISDIEAALKTIKIGVSAWYTVAGHSDRGGEFWSRDLGYSRVGDDWCIALRRQWGAEWDDEGPHEEVWKFSDAPRWMCIEAVGKLP